MVLLYAVTTEVVCGGILMVSDFPVSPTCVTALAVYRIRLLVVGHKADHNYEYFKENWLSQLTFEAINSKYSSSKGGGSCVFKAVEALSENCLLLYSRPSVLDCKMDPFR